MHAWLQGPVCGLLFVHLRAPFHSGVSTAAGGVNAALFAGQPAVFLVPVLVLLAAALMGACFFLVGLVRANRRHKRQIQSLTFFDPLTRLPNWEKMRREVLQQRCGFFALFDIKNFKLYNELFGRAYGDKLLMGIAHKLKNMEKTSAGEIYVCRDHSDCFGILFTAGTEQEILEKLQDLFRDLQQQDKLNKISMRFACGVAPVLLTDEQDIAVLQDCANFARNNAKSSAKTQIVFFDGQAKREVIARQVLTGELDEAALQGDLIVAYQPQYALKTGKIIGAEALIRWQHPERGLLMPDVFVPAFIENGSIERIDKYISEKVMQQMSMWKKTGINLVPVSVNLSWAQFSDPLLAGQLRKLLRKNDITPAFFRLELTENNLYGDVDTLVAGMSELRKLGFSISMDDFGVGSSSLGLLRRLPLDVVKLDKSFLPGIETDEKQQNYVRDIIAMMHHLGMGVLIEGVETLEQAKFMRNAQCDYAQGFWFSRPLTPAEFSALLQEKGDPRIGAGQSLR